VIDGGGLLYSNTVYGGSSNCLYGLGFRLRHDLHIDAAWFS